MGAPLAAARPRRRHGSGPESRPRARARLAAKNLRPPMGLLARLRDVPRAAAVSPARARARVVERARGLAEPSARAAEPGPRGAPAREVRRAQPDSPLSRLAIRARTTRAAERQRRGRLSTRPASRSAETAR